MRPLQSRCISSRKSGRPSARLSQVSAVRQDCPEGRPRRVFRYCCGQRRRLDQIRNPLNPAFYRSISEGFQPSRWIKAALTNRVVQAAQGGLIHRRPSEWWISHLWRWTESGEAIRGRRFAGVPPPARGRRSLASVALGKQAQAQRVELDEALRVLLVVGASIVLERDVPFRVERIRRLAPDH